MFVNKKVIDKKKAGLVEITFYSEEKKELKDHDLEYAFGYNVKDIKVTYTEAALEKCIYPQKHKEITEEGLEKDK